MSLSASIILPEKFTALLLFLLAIIKSNAKTTWNELLFFFQFLVHKSTNVKSPTTVLLSFMHKARHAWWAEGEVYPSVTGMVFSWKILHFCVTQVGRNQRTQNFEWHTSWMVPKDLVKDLIFTTDIFTPKSIKSKWDFYLFRA